MSYVKWKRVHKNLKFKFYHYFKPTKSVAFDDVLGTGIVPLPSIEKLCEVGRNGAENAELYQNAFGDYYIGILMNGWEPKANDANFVLKKFVSCRVRVKYYLLASKHRANTNCTS